jgi:transcriptional regulator with XRE-family HTH domain
MTNLQRIRNSRGLSLSQLSKLCGMGIRHIHRFERGESPVENMTARNLKRLADALNVQMEDLLDPSD